MDDNALGSVRSTAVHQQKQQKCRGGGRESLSFLTTAATQQQQRQQQQQQRRFRHPLAVLCGQEGVWRLVCELAGVPLGRALRNLREFEAILGELIATKTPVKEE